MVRAGSGLITVRPRRHRCGTIDGVRPFELRGERVWLAAPTRDDVDQITELCQDPDIQRWTTVPSPYTRRDAYWFVHEHVRQGWEAGAELTWAVRDRDRGVRGMIALRLDGAGSAELGFWLGAAFRDSGLIVEAARLVADRAFDPDGLDLTRLVWRASIGNWASRRVAWKLGFRFHGVVRKELGKHGERHDAWLATLLADEPREPAQRWFDVPTLSADGVLLRRWRPSDADAVAEACTDPVTRHWLGSLPDPYTRESALQYIAGREEAHATARGIHWAAAADDHRPALGSFSFMNTGEPEIRKAAEVGYWVAPAARGRGIATSAVRLMVTYAFTPAAAGGLGLR
ncbi:MAG: GNAT family N-acetyltransferase, partial [Jiangellaceae bacterium]|nr:GNAT family N-acetyltransferase [Jiangellaceae bacterium]